MMSTVTHSDRLFAVIIYNCIHSEYDGWCWLLFRYCIYHMPAKQCMPVSRERWKNEHTGMMCVCGVNGPCAIAYVCDTWEHNSATESERVCDRKTRASARTVQKVEQEEDECTLHIAYIVCRRFHSVRSVVPRMRLFSFFFYYLAAAATTTKVQTNQTDRNQMS